MMFKLILIVLSLQPVGLANELEGKVAEVDLGYHTTQFWCNKIGTAAVEKARNVVGYRCEEVK